MISSLQNRGQWNTTAAVVFYPALLFNVSFNLFVL